MKKRNFPWRIWSILLFAEFDCDFFSTIQDQASETSPPTTTSPDLVDDYTAEALIRSILTVSDEPNQSYCPQPSKLMILQRESFWNVDDDF